jgi:hypothetical protein
VIKFQEGLELYNDNVSNEPEILEDLLFSAVSFCDSHSHICEVCKCDTYSGVRLYLNSHKEVQDNELNFFHLKVMDGYRGIAILCDECWCDFEKPLKKLTEKIINNIRSDEEEYFHSVKNSDEISKPLYNH